MMPDREKVIKGLEHCKDHDGKDCPQCPYFDVLCVDDLCADALAMLKEREAVEPLAQVDDTFECSCGAIVGWDEMDSSGIVKTRFNYCPFCGRPVKWE